MAMATTMLRTLVKTGFIAAISSKDFFCGVGAFVSAGATAGAAAFFLEDFFLPLAEVRLRGLGGVTFARLRGLPVEVVAAGDDFLAGEEVLVGDPERLRGLMGEVLGPFFLTGVDFADSDAAGLPCFLAVVVLRVL